MYAHTITPYHRSLPTLATPPVISTYADKSADRGRRQQGEHALSAAGYTRQAEAAGQHEPDEGAREGQRAGGAPARARDTRQDPEAKVHVPEVSGLFEKGSPPDVAATRNDIGGNYD